MTPYELEVARYVKKELVGRTITDVRHGNAADAANLGWYERPVIILLDNGAYLVPSSDPEGNSAGTLFTFDPDTSAIVPVKL